MIFTDVFVVVIIIIVVVVDIIIIIIIIVSNETDPPESTKCHKPRGSSGRASPLKKHGIKKRDQAERKKKRDREEIRTEETY